MSMTLGELLAGTGRPGVLSRARVIGPDDVSVSSVVIDSRAVTAGSVFCCIRGAAFDGHTFAASAVASGAAAIVVDHELDLPAGVPQVVVDDVRAAVGHLAAVAHGRPADRLMMVGVTGTNGKTTTTAMIASILGAAGRRVGVIGTLSGARTTPEAPELQERLASFLAEGIDTVVMEVSSHALLMHRVNGCHFDAAVFTNLSRDHLDLHGTMEQYFAAKARLFDPALSQRGITCVDDPHGRLLLDASPIPSEGWSIDDVSDASVTPTRVRATWRSQVLDVPLGGEFNLSNAIGAATCAAALGVDAATIAAGLASLEPVPGRMEAVPGGHGFDVIVDSAHTPDGLAAALSAARPGRPGRLVVVFGCGGDRDREKRPEMGRIAAEGADLVVVTSDNPRSEDPQAIIDAILGGVGADYRAHVLCEPDRRRAIEAAVGWARPGDVVLIAGKGHEATQTIGASVLPFDDRAVAREVLSGGTVR